MKLKCIIIDDEPIARKILQEFIEEINFLIRKVDGRFNIDAQVGELRFEPVHLARKLAA